MSPKRRIGADQRRMRLGIRHRLAQRATSAEQVADALVALHGTDPATVFLAVGARIGTDPVPLVEQALYETRTMVRMLGMRRTMFAVTTELAPIVHASSTRAVAKRQRTNLLKYLRDGGGWDERWLAQVEQDVLAALRERGQATASELGFDVPQLREKVIASPGKPYETTQAVASRILGVLAAEDRIVRGRPLGSWISSQHRWILAPGMPEIPIAQAQSELVRRWLEAYGPATVADIKWWTGWNLTEVRKALAAVDAEEVELDEGAGWALPGDTEPIDAPEPWAALLPSLDPTPMGRQYRDWYLPPEHQSALFDGSGNIGPTVWWNGRIIGGWAQRPNGDIAWRLLTDSGTEVTAALETEAARLTSWLGDTRITPRFRTPLERELSA